VHILNFWEINHAIPSHLGLFYIIICTLRCAVIITKSIIVNSKYRLIILTKRYVNDSAPIDENDETWGNRKILPCYAQFSLAFGFWWNSMPDISSPVLRCEFNRYIVRILFVLIHSQFNRTAAKKNLIDSVISAWGVLFWKDILPSPFLYEIKTKQDLSACGAQRRSMIQWYANLSLRIAENKRWVE
jgi:hypothetical protein